MTIVNGGCSELISKKKKDKVYFRSFLKYENQDINTSRSKGNGYLDRLIVSE